MRSAFTDMNSSPLEALPENSASTIPKYKFQRLKSAGVSQEAGRTATLAEGQMF